jgi:multisubunit Na+/H+ antiporter MnhF subunit
MSVALTLALLGFLLTNAPARAANSITNATRGPTL